MNFLMEPWKGCVLAILTPQPTLVCCSFHRFCQNPEQWKRLHEVTIARDLQRREAFSSSWFFTKQMSISTLPSLLSPTDALDQLNRSTLKDVTALAKPFGDLQLLWIMLWLSLPFKWLRSREFGGIRYLWEWPTSSISFTSPRMGQYRENLWAQTSIWKKTGPQLA